MNGTMSLLPGTYRRIPLHHKIVFPHGYYAVYIATQDIICGKCGEKIAVNTLFRCATMDNCQPRKENKSFPHCRSCLPFNLYLSEKRESLLPMDEEVTELKKRPDFPVF